MTSIPPGYPPHRPVPPTQPGAVEPSQKPSTWPTFVGIISIVLGSTGILVNLCGLSGTLMMSSFQSMLNSMPQGPNNEVMTQGMVEVMAKWGPWLALAVGVAMLVSILLLVAGIFTVQRRRASARFSLAWAVVRIVSAIALVGAQAGYNRDLMDAQFQAMQQMHTQTGFPGPSPVTMMGGLFDGMATITWIFGLGWSWAYPIFILIWFNRRAIRDEIATWP